MRPPTTNKYPAAWQARAVQLAVASAHALAPTAPALGVPAPTRPPWSGPYHRVARQAPPGPDGHLSEA